MGKNSNITASASQLDRNITTLSSSVVSPNHAEHGPRGKEIVFHVRFEEMRVRLYGVSGRVGFVGNMSFKVKVGTARFEGCAMESKVRIGCGELGLVVSSDQPEILILDGSPRKFHARGVKWRLETRKEDVRLVFGTLAIFGICILTGILGICFMCAFVERRVRTSVHVVSDA